jgi:methylase of polypeptide subunit release factors
MLGREIYMKDDHIQRFVHDYLKSHVNKNDIMIDATVGNGNDTILLASLAKHVIGYDIQSRAIETTREKLIELNVDNVTLRHQSFEKIENVIDYRGVVFNLGYLPGGDKSITTQPDVTLKTIEVIIKQMDIADFILITAYPGHESGLIEAERLMLLIQKLDTSYVTLTYQIHNRMHAPFVIIIEKQKPLKNAS